MNTESQILNVPIEDIIPNRFQPRLNFDEASLKELAASIKQHGIIQPLVLRRLGDKYEIIAGERRYKASKIAGLTSVPAIISMLDDNQSAEIAIVENVQRKDLSAIEEAKSYKALLDKGYLNQEELAKKMGISQSSISNKLRLLSLDDRVQKALMNGEISERHARSLLKIEDKEEQYKWLKIILEERLTVQNLEKRIKSEYKKEDDVPIVNTIPSIEDIRQNATDIVDVKPVVANEPVEELSFETPIKENIEPEKIPNKFFNFLEDESANMNIFENNTPPVIEQPSINNIQEPEEVEMLDFLAPIEKTFDISTATNIINETVNKLKENGYIVNLSQEDNDKIKYIIEIDKN